MLTRLEVMSVLDYNGHTGVFTWQFRRYSRMKAGNIAGTIMKDGYRRIKIFGKSYYAHRLAILIMTGFWPKQLGDHINGIRDDNRWDNLRNTNPPHNAANKKKPKQNSSGAKGVSFHKRDGKYIARIQLHKKSKYIGSFDTLEEADRAYKIAASELFKEYVRAQQHQ